jgi:hypothetical protein
VVRARIVGSLLLATVASSCLQVTYERHCVDVPVSRLVLESLQPGRSDLTEALTKLGAPREVWELSDEGLALAYGAEHERGWNWQVSVPLSQGVDAQFSYDDTAGHVNGHVLFFDAGRSLRLVRSGKLHEISREARRRRPSVPE